jgi:hypothetical protein
MTSQQVQCPKCKTPLFEGAFNLPHFSPCGVCEAPVQVQVFPAFYNPPKTESLADQPVIIDGESSCFYHPEKKAVIPCESCGRFLCGLCDCLLNGQHFCPNCLETGRTKGKIKSLENRRTLHDNAALSLSLLPLILAFYITFITAPMAIYIAIRNWNAPRSLVSRTRFRFVLAIFFAVLQIVGWVLIVFFAINA